MGSVLRGAEKALAKTPDLLPVLKEVGVVDSGGQGLVFIYNGFFEALTGEAVPVQSLQSNKSINFSWLTTKQALTTNMYQQATSNSVTVLKSW